MAARLVSFVRVLSRASQLAGSALNRVTHASRPCQEFTAAQISKRFQFANVQFLGRTFSTLTPGWRNGDKLEISNLTSAGFTDLTGPLLRPSRLLPLSNVQPQRNHIRFSRCQGKQKTVKAAVKRFYRLDWGGWIRTIAGRRKKLWRKWWKRRQRLRRHIFVNNTQAKLLNHMVTGYWKKPKYYVDDPYEPYHVRHDIRKKSSRDRLDL